MKTKFQLGDMVKITHCSLLGKLAIIVGRYHYTHKVCGDAYRLKFEDTKKSMLVYEKNFVLVGSGYQDFQDKIKDRMS